MVKRIIIGVDGGDAARAAVEWGARLATAAGSEVTIASAWSPEEDFGEQSTERDRRDQRHWLLDHAWSDAAREQGATVTTKLLEGPAQEELVRLAHAEDADLVVIGASVDPEHRNRIAHHLLHHLHVPLAVVPQCAAPIGERDLVVGIDGSRASDAALRWAVEAATDLRVGIVAVFAHHPLADSYPHPDLENWPYHGEEAVRAELRRGGTDHVHVRLERLAGEPATVLSRVAAELDAGALVAGTRGRGGFHGLRVGSVAIHLVDDPSAAVVIVPH